MRHLFAFGILLCFLCLLVDSSTGENNQQFAQELDEELEEIELHRNKRSADPQPRPAPRRGGSSYRSSRSSRSYRSSGGTGGVSAGIVDKPNCFFIASIILMCAAAYCLRAK